MLQRSLLLPRQLEAEVGFTNDCANQWIDFGRMLKSATTTKNILARHKNPVSCNTLAFVTDNANVNYVTVHSTFHLLQERKTAVGKCKLPSWRGMQYAQIQYRNKSAGCWWYIVLTLFVSLLGRKKNLQKGSTRLQPALRWWRKLQHDVTLLARWLFLKLAGYSAASPVHSPMAYGLNWEGNLRSVILPWASCEPAGGFESWNQEVRIRTWFRCKTLQQSKKSRA